MPEIIKDERNWKVKVSLDKEVCPFRRNTFKMARWFFSCCNQDNPKWNNSDDNAICNRDDCPIVDWGNVGRKIQAGIQHLECQTKEREND